MISAIDLKMLSSDELRKVKEMTEEELEFREEVGREIERRKQENVNGS
tara:strand:- start:2111 stop:2254 length:144 start_codon:yes stop_codon:yes gene_type:complete